MAAASLVAQYGAQVVMVDSGTIDSVYSAVKARLKQLYTREPPVFMAMLPPTPADLVRQHRDFALSVFSSENPPVPCPLNILAVDQVRSRINMRGLNRARSSDSLASGGSSTGGRVLISFGGGDRFLLMLALGY